MTANQIRQKYLEFFESKKHKIIPSASLVPENDPTVLFTTAGMHPLVPYLLGEKHPLGNRLTNSQKCVRTDDILEVGDRTHLTFFEMLGNWSLGDYFKKQAIEWSFEFLTKELNIPIEKLAFSVFEGEVENNIPRDEESARIWQGLGIPKQRIAYLGRKDNWWGPAGKTGPCGPDTEMFYWLGSGIDGKPAPERFDPSDDRWVEIWNNVFMEYNQTADGKFVELSQKNVDTGMGLERIVAVLQGKNNVFGTDLFLPIIGKIRQMAGKEAISSENARKSERVIVDHLKAAVFILSEKITPSNLDRGYVLRRLIRRAIRHGKLIGIKDSFTSDIAREVIEIYKSVYPEVGKFKEFIVSELEKEESGFAKTLDRGLREFEKLSAGQTKKEVNGKEAFNLYQTYGFPIEMTKELAQEKGIKVDESGFEQELSKHQNLSRTAAAGKFKAGLADHSGETVKYHTATHLLLAGLREVLGKQIEQRGSNITPERIRFDFSFDRKMTDGEVKQVESWVNEQIAQDLQVKVEEMSVEQAQEQGALACFRERYPDKVKVYTIFNPKTEQVVSKEICSGPHVKNLQDIGDLGKFKIVKEQSSSSGVRRIKAVLG